MARVPSVLLWLNSSLSKKYGKSLTAHLCLSTSLSRAAWTPCTFLGVTQLRITSSPTGSSELSTSLSVARGGDGVDGVKGLVSVLVSTSLNLEKVSTSIVGRS